MQNANSYTFDRQAMYRIRVEGRLDPIWSDRLAGMAISHEISVEEGPTTILLGELRDQASLAGVLDTLYELHRPVLLVKRLSAEESASNEAAQ